MRALSASEWELMLICWDLGAPSAREVHQASLGNRRRNYRTVLATLNNIAVKGYLKVEKQPGPRNIPTNRYVPAIARGPALERRIRRFLEHDLRWDPTDLALLSSIIDRSWRA